MASGISISKEVLKADFERVAQNILDAYGVDLCLAEIMGRRWSYIAGRKKGGNAFSPPQRIRLTGRFGIVSDGWERIPASEGTLLIESLKKAVEEHG